MLQDDYQITLENFRGPLDLLLYLIRRAEVDIHDIPIATVTDQYLAFLAQIEDVDIDSAGEFLVMAATLIEIKSRVLMPVEKRPEEGGEGTPDATGIDSADPRYELVQQLLAYQKYRIAAEELEKRRQAFAQRFAAEPARVRREGEPEESDPIEIELEDAHVLDLSEAYERILASIDLTRLGDHTVEVDDTPIALFQDDLMDQLERAAERRLTLQQAFDGRNAGQRIGMFLAMLELVRLRRITVVQESVDEDVVLVVNDDPEAVESPT